MFVILSDDVGWWRSGTSRNGQSHRQNLCASYISLVFVNGIQVERTDLPTFPTLHSYYHMLLTGSLNITSTLFLMLSFYIHLFFVSYFFYCLFADEKLPVTLFQHESVFVFMSQNDTIQPFAPTFFYKCFRIKSQNLSLRSYMHANDCMGRMSHYDSFLLIRIKL